MVLSPTHPPNQGKYANSIFPHTCAPGPSYNKLSRAESQLPLPSNCSHDVGVLRRQIANQLFSKKKKTPSSSFW
jgi:hypothetical protein